MSTDLPTDPPSPSDGPVDPGDPVTPVSPGGVVDPGGLADRSDEAGPVDLQPRLDPTPLVVARYPAGWWPSVTDGVFVALVVDPGETTVVAAEDVLETLPPPVATERGWQRITFAGPLPWELVGFLADVAGRLAAARIPFTSISGFTTDHVLVRAAQAGVALSVLRGEPAPELRPGVTNP